jgi:hypothetical protein
MSEVDMALQVIEGTWEEIKRHEAEFIGRQLRVTIKPETSVVRKQSTPKKSTVAPKPKVLRGMGAFKGMTGGSEAFAEEKRGEIEREERHF